LSKEFYEMFPRRLRRYSVKPAVSATVDKSEIEEGSGTVEFGLVPGVKTASLIEPVSSSDDCVLLPFAKATSFMVNKNDPLPSVPVKLTVWPGPKSIVKLFALLLLIVPVTSATIGFEGLAPSGIVKITVRSKFPKFVPIVLANTERSRIEKVPKFESVALPPEVTLGPKLAPTKRPLFVALLQLNNNQFVASNTDIANRQRCEVNGETCRTLKGSFEVIRLRHPRVSFRRVAG